MKLYKLYKFRPLGNCKDLCRIKKIIDEGFHCSDFLSFNDVNEGVFYKNKYNEKISLEIKMKYKICSFSREKALKSQLMWGHYANAGMGVAIEVEAEYKAKNRGDVKRVSYKNELPNGDIEEILTRKSIKWRYENEYRYIKEKEQEHMEEGEKDKIYKDCIKKIYFGTPYKGLENYDDIKDEHTNLKEYLELKKVLEKNCNGIPCDDYEFNF